LFLNLATTDGSCSFCSAVYQRELQVRKKFKETFADKHQTLVYLQPELKGIEQLRQMGSALYR
jgi:anion-transporting  ArsA/GET3 family ATPase